MTTLKKVGAWIMGMLTLLLLIGLLGGPPSDRGAGFFIVLLFAAATYFLWRAAQRGSAADRKAAEERERVRQVALQQRVIDLAISHGGVLTVTDVVADLDYPVDAAEQLLRALDDGARVASSVTEEGVIVYEFREVMHRQARPGKPLPGAGA